MFSLRNKHREEERDREIMKGKDRKIDRQVHVQAFYQPPLSIVMPGGNESYLSSSRSRSGSCREGSKVFEHKWKVEPPCEIAPGNGTDTPLMGGFTRQVYLPGEALHCHGDSYKAAQ